MRQFLNITPAGKVLPCHAAESLTFLEFDNIKDKPLSWIWEHSESFNRFRGLIGCQNLVGHVIEEK